MGIKYFTARVSFDNEKIKRQQTYLEALETLPNVETIEGVYFSHKANICNTCGKPFCCGCGKVFLKIEEKMTDVNIAVNMMCDAFSNKYDIAYLITGGSDLAPVIEKIRLYFPEKLIIVYFPPNRVSKRLRDICHAERKFYENTFKNSQFSNQLTNKYGYLIERPMKWR